MLNNVRVSHLFEEGDFADGGARNALVFGFESDLLQGNDSSAISKVPSFVHDAVRSCEGRDTSA
jgi:hypothetical protein